MMQPNHGPRLERSAARFSFRCTPRTKFVGSGLHQQCPAVEETKTDIRVTPAAARERAGGVARHAPAQPAQLRALRRHAADAARPLQHDRACSSCRQNVEGFDKYFAELTPATRLLFGTLGFFDIYHAWYFNVLLLVLSLNIVLASIDRFPGAWAYVRKPKVEAGPVWLKTQQSTRSVERRRRVARGGGAARGAARASGRLEEAARDGEGRRARSSSRSAARGIVSARTPSTSGC